MKKLYYLGLLGLALFEIMNVYFIMPMPGSQASETITAAYFLYTYRWIFRIVFALLIVTGALSAFRVKSPWLPVLALLPVLFIVYAFNFKMTADKMFRQPHSLSFVGRNENTLNDSSLVIAVVESGEAKAYPIRYIQYHHQVRDSVGQKAVMVTYCNVCRTGRVFQPLVKGKPEKFRLVGMDHFNAMFEDETTLSWWRQATGEAIAGTLKGEHLPEMEAYQLSLNKFFALYPFGKVMQPDSLAYSNYDSLRRFERGKSKSDLTRTDSLSWNDKSWVLGIKANKQAKAYDWNDLKRLRVINDIIGNTPVVLAIASDDQSFAAFVRNEDEQFTIRNDSLISANHSFDFAGRNAEGLQLKKLNASQEFWHSWKQFHPETGRY
jgi:hypothetical protein